MTAIWALGFMSGTSMDGVDAALLRTDGVRIDAFGPSLTRPYDPAERARLRDAAQRAAAGETDRTAFTDVAAMIADAHAQAAERLLAEPSAARPALIGFHGQTLLHQPERGFSLQIGDAARLARRLRAPVVWDFRSADLAAGGQGAPLAPFYHFALAQRFGDAAPTAFLNLGGVGNVTFVDPAAAGPDAPSALVAFDTGPANALIDDWMRARAGQTCDQDGAAAAAGSADLARVRRWVSASAYLAQTPPKSLDRDAFAWIAADMNDLSVEDGAATLTAFTAETVAAAAAFAPSPPSRWLLCGGGRRNPALVAALRAALGAAVAPVEAIGADGDALEAQAFAHLAVRSRRSLPISSPGVTGAPSALTGGRLAAAD